MRVLSLSVVFVLASLVACTADFPTADVGNDEASIQESVLAKSEHAAGVIRGERNLFLWFIDPATGMEFDFFDPAVLCTEGFDAAVQRRSVQWVIREERGGDPDDLFDDRYIRVQKGDDIMAVASPAFWSTCEEWFGWRDAGLVDYGTADVHSNDNDLWGFTERQNANAWHWTGHGKLYTSSGDRRILNFVDQCVWVGTDFDDIRCHSNFVYK